MSSPETASSAALGDARVGDARATSRRGAWSSLALTTGVLVVMALVSMGDAVARCDGVVRGRPNDGTTGAVWLAWAWEQTGGGPFRAVQYLTGGDLGDVLWRPLLVVNLFVWLPLWALTQVVGPVCAYNLVFVLGTVTSGLGMWVLVRSLVGGRIVPACAAVIFAFTSFSQLKTEWGHLTGVLLGLFPLLLLGVVRLWERPTPGRVLAVGACWGALPYVDGYHLAFAPLLVGGFAAGAVFLVWRAREQGWQRWVGARLLASAAAGAVALVVLVPWLAVLAADFGAASDQTTRPDEDAGRYGARWWEYVLPSPRHPLAPEAYREWRFEHMHRSNVAETALYLGVVVVVLAVIGARWWLRSAGSGTSTTGTAQFRRTVVGGLLGVVLVAFVTSLNPDVTVAGIAVPMPAELVRLVLPQVRVFSRLVIVVATAVVPLAAIGLATLVARRPARGGRFAVAGGLTALALFETLTFTPWDPPTWAYERTPAVFVDLAQDAEVDTVALYPMHRAGEDGSVLHTYQPVLGKVLVNPASDTGALDDPADVVRGLAALDDPQSLPGLRALGTDVVVVTSDEVDGGGAAVPDGLVLAGRFECGPGSVATTGGSNRGAARDAQGRDCLPARVYRVAPGAVADAVVALGAGWERFEPQGFGGRRSFTDGAELSVVPVGVGRDADGSDAGEVQVRFVVQASAAGSLRVIDGADELVTVPLGGGGTDVRFDTVPGRRLVLRLDAGGTVHASGFEVLSASR